MSCDDDDADEEDDDDDNDDDDDDDNDDDDRIFAVLAQGAKAKEENPRQHVASSCTHNGEGSGVQQLRKV